MAGLAAELALPSPARIRGAFERSAPTFAAASVVHDEARRRLLERLPFVRLEAETLLDLGCGHASGARELAARFPAADVIAVDASLAMLTVAREDPRRSSRRGRVFTVQADATRLPLTSRSADLILANLLLPWCDPNAVFAEAARVLAPGGLLLFSTLGPDTLREVRRAWARVDDALHVHAFFDMHDIGDLAVRAGLEEPVIDVERIELSYRNVRALVLDLRACGATNIAAGRRPTLTGPARWRGFEQALVAEQRDGRFTVTMELILGQAWGRTRNVREPAGEVTIPAHDIPVRH